MWVLAADDSPWNKLSSKLQPLLRLLPQASKRFPHLREHADFLNTKTGANRWSGMVKQLVAGRVVGALVRWAADCGGDEGGCRMWLW
jgi:hypothetical protein